jgi:hypothetical protein
VGVAAFRGCYRDNGSPSNNPLAPKPNGSTNCVLDDGSGSSQVTQLIYNPTTLNTLINNINAQGGSGTNVCNGLAKGWEVLEGPGNHLGQENNLRYLILLSDGDNNYNGSYSYQSSPYDSPHTYQTLSCRPPTSCSNVGGDSSSGSDPCHSGVYPGITSINDSFASGWASGTGWAGNWIPNSGTAAVVTTTNASPPGGQGGSGYYLRLGRGGSPTTNGSVYRQFSLQYHNTANLSYYIRRNTNFSGSDEVRVQVSSDGSTWTTLRTHNAGTNNPASGSWSQYSTLSLNSYVGDASVYVRFHVQSMDNTADQVYIDTVAITGSGSSDGWINGSVPSPSCSSTPVKRERQLDLQTWEMAKAVKADDVEIYVVAFGVCSSNSTQYTTAQCEAQIGNTDNDNTGDQRLMKCIASSKPGTNDHYFYASSASALPTIFTQIAKQIAHRLVE